MDKTINKSNPKSAARLAVAQSYYSILLDKPQNQESALKNVFDVMSKENIKVKKKFAEDLLKFCIAEKESIEFIIKKYVDRENSIEMLNPLLLAIITTAIGELLLDTKTDRPIIISEYMNITSEFFGTQEIGFVNAIMDKFIKDNK